MSDYIPFEMQMEIIKMLPVKSLIQFRSVSKQWKSAIDSSDFISDYTARSNDNDNQPQHLLVIRYEYPFDQTTYFSIVDDNTFPHLKVSLTAPHSVNLLLRDDSDIVGTSHGLFCIFGYHHDPDDHSEYESEVPMVVLWNPLISKSVAIDVPDEDRSTFGFGVCRATNDPKIVKIDNEYTKSVMVYTLSSGVWRRAHGSLPNSFIDNFLEFKRPQSQVTINGLIYWFAAVNFAYNLLVSFDLSSEEFREIYLPSKLALHDSMDLFLCSIKDSVAVIKGSLTNEKYQVWVMSNGLSKQFKKHFTVRMPYELPYSSSLPFGFRKNGELMMALTTDNEDSDALVAYEPLSKHFSDIGIEGRRGSFFVSSYTESLILLDR